MRTLTLIIFAAAVVICVSHNCFAAVQVFHNNKAGWQAAVGSYTTIDFTGYPIGTVITSQYQYLGVTFTQGNDFIQTSNTFLNDGWGLDGGVFSNSIAIGFSEPRYSVAVDTPHTISVWIGYGNQLVYMSGIFTGGPGTFVGLTSTKPFDTVLIIATGVVMIDDLFFGPPIPAPGALALLGLAALRSRRRRNE